MAKRRNRTFTAKELETTLQGAFYTSLAGIANTTPDEHEHEHEHEHQHEWADGKSDLHDATTMYRFLFEHMEDLYHRVGFRMPNPANTPSHEESIAPLPPTLTSSGNRFRNGTLSSNDPLAQLAIQLHNAIANKPLSNMDNSNATPFRDLSYCNHQGHNVNVIQGLSDYNDQQSGLAVLVTTQNIANKLNRMEKDGTPHACELFIVLEGITFTPHHCGIIIPSKGGDVTADTAMLSLMNTFYPLITPIPAVSNTHTHNNEPETTQVAPWVWLSNTLRPALRTFLKDTEEHSPTYSTSTITITPENTATIMDSIFPNYTAGNGNTSDKTTEATSATSTTEAPVWHPQSHSSSRRVASLQLLATLLSWELRWMLGGYLEISPRAFVHPTATLGEGCRIGSFVHISAGVTIGKGCTISPSAHIESGVTIGDFCEIGSGTTISAEATIGNNVSLHNSVTIGGDGFGFRFIAGEFVKVPQVGSVRIGSNVEVGSGTTIDRGAIRDTVIGSGCKIDNQCHIAHNVVLGRGCIMAGKSAVAGSSTLGDYVMMGGASSVADHITVASGIRLYATTSVSKNLTQAGGIYVGTPAKLWEHWSRERIMLSFLTQNSKILKTIIKKEREDYES